MKTNDNEIIILDCGDEKFEITMTDLIKSLNEYGYTVVKVSDFN